MIVRTWKSAQGLRVNCADAQMRKKMKKQKHDYAMAMPPFVQEKKLSRNVTSDHKEYSFGRKNLLSPRCNANGHSLHQTLEGSLDTTERFISVASKCLGRPLNVNDSKHLYPMPREVYLPSLNWSTGKRNKTANKLGGKVRFHPKLSYLIKNKSQNTHEKNIWKKKFSL